MIKQLKHHDIPSTETKQISLDLKELMNLKKSSKPEYKGVIDSALAIGSDFIYMNASMFWGDQTFSLPVKAAYLGSVCRDKFYDLFSDAYELDLDLDDPLYRDLIGYIVKEVIGLVKNEEALQSYTVSSYVWTTVECCSCYKMIRSKLAISLEWGESVCQACNI
jgi:hypothetical protein